MKLPVTRHLLSDCSQHLKDSWVFPRGSGTQASFLNFSLGSYARPSPETGVLPQLNVTCTWRE
jgi:hypothetical protein